MSTNASDSSVKKIQTVQNADLRTAIGAYNMTYNSDTNHSSYCIVFMVMYGNLWWGMVVYGIVFMVLYDIIWYGIVLYSIIWHCLAVYDIVWFCLVLYDMVLYCMVLYGLVW